MKPLAIIENFDDADFLNRYWGQSPCLIRNWLQPQALAIQRLLELAEAHELPSRLVSGSSEADDWQVDHGPLGADDLPQQARDWTLLVQEMDKVSAPVAAILDNFRFLPHWALDDVMISQAVPGGSVGPHRDAYDVFLVQVEGKREWQLSDCDTVEIDQRFELALISNWRADQTIQTRPGDVLYLPPGVGHHGVALDNCQTWSIGLRTPSGPELLFQLADENLARPEFSTRLAIDQLQPDCADQITPALINQARKLLEHNLALDDQQLGQLLAGFLTRWRLWPNDDFIELEVVTRHLRAGHRLALARTARVALLEIDKERAVFVNGERIACPPAVAVSLSQTRQIDQTWLEHETALEQLLESSAIARPKGPVMVS